MIPSRRFDGASQASSASSGASKIVRARMTYLADHVRAGRCPCDSTSNSYDLRLYEVTPRAQRAAIGDERIQAEFEQAVENHAGARHIGVDDVSGVDIAAAAKQQLIAVHAELAVENRLSPDEGRGTMRGSRRLHRIFGIAPRRAAGHRAPESFYEDEGGHLRAPPQTRRVARR